MRRYLDDSICPICLKDFHTRTNVLNHVKYRLYICAVNLLQGPPIITESEANNLDLSNAIEDRRLYALGLRRHKTSHPCIRVFGPIIDLKLQHKKIDFVRFGHNYKWSN